MSASLAALPDDVVATKVLSFLEAGELRSVAVTCESLRRCAVSSNAERTCPVAGSVAGLAARFTDCSAPRRSPCHIVPAPCGKESCAAWCCDDGDLDERVRPARFEWDDEAESGIGADADAGTFLVEFKGGAAMKLCAPPLGWHRRDAVDRALEVVGYFQWDKAWRRGYLIATCLSPRSARPQDNYLQRTTAGPWDNFLERTTWYEEELWSIEVRGDVTTELCDDEEISTVRHASEALAREFASRAIWAKKEAGFIERSNVHLARFTFAVYDLSGYRSDGASKTAALPLTPMAHSYLGEHEYVENEYYIMNDLGDRETDLGRFSLSRDARTLALPVFIRRKKIKAWIFKRRSEEDWYYERRPEVTCWESEGFFFQGFCNLEVSADGNMLACMIEDFDFDFDFYPKYSSNITVRDTREGGGEILNVSWTGPSKNGMVDLAFSRYNRIALWACDEIFVREYFAGMIYPSVLDMTIYIVEDW